ncbi:MAG TPA: pilus assembly protein PilM [Candidatus Manganitrophaceae bacterium]|nr:pilus assembly protein PilM [Candidatus Manganitrophaceae bacterium]
MAQISIGLDIGQHSIKGVRVAQSFRGLRLVDSFERKVPRREGDHLSSTELLTAGQIEALKGLIEEGRIRPGEGAAVSLPGQLVSTREMAVPFADPKKLRQIVPFEVESQLPFDLEEVAIDYLLLQSNADAEGAGGTSQLLVSVVPKVGLQKYLSTLQSIGIDPAAIGLDSLSLYHFAQYFLPGKKEEAPSGDPAAGLLVIDVGASKTVLCHLRGGKLHWVRTFPMGGDLLTEALRKEFELSWEEAERFKAEIDLNDAGPGAPGPAGRGARGAECLQQALIPWRTEIEKSLRSRTAASGGDRAGAENPAGESVFYLAGGGGALKGLGGLLSESLGMRAISLPRSGTRAAASLAGLESVNPDSVGYLYAQGLGLALPPPEGSSINFRQGEFVFGKETIEKRNRMVSIGLVALLLLGLMGGDFYLHYSQKEKRYQELKGELRKVFAATFPQSKNVSNEVEQARAAITELNRTGGFLGVGEESPLQVLKEISAAVPKEVRIDVQELAIDGNKVRIEAQTDSFESVDRIRGGLMKVDAFKEVNVSDAKVAADQSRVGFRIQMTVMPSVKKGAGDEKQPS